MNILFYNNYCFFLNITICLSIVNVPIKSVVLFLFFQPIRIHLCIDNQSRQYFPVKEVECVQPSYNRIHVVISFILINQSLQRLFGVKESERYIYILDDFMVQWEREWDVRSWIWSWWWRTHPKYLTINNAHHLNNHLRIQIQCHKRRQPKCYNC